MFKMMQVLFNHKEALEKTFNGEADGWDEAEAEAAEVASVKAGNWQLWTDRQNERFGEEEDW